MNVSQSIMKLVQSGFSSPRIQKGVWFFSERDQFSNKTELCTSHLLEENMRRVVYGKGYV